MAAVRTMASMRAVRAVIAVVCMIAVVAVRGMMCVCSSCSRTGIAYRQGVAVRLLSQCAFRSQQGSCTDDAGSYCPLKKRVL